MSLAAGLAPRVASDAAKPHSAVRLARRPAALLGQIEQFIDPLQHLERRIGRGWPRPFAIVR
jgi:hypothetical protein